MTTYTYFPNACADQIIWLTQYANKLPINGPNCQITTQEITDTLFDINYYIWMLQHWHPAIQFDANESLLKLQLGIQKPPTQDEIDIWVSQSTELFLKGSLKSTDII